MAATLRASHPPLSIGLSVRSSPQSARSVPFPSPMREAYADRMAGAAGAATAVAPARLSYQPSLDGIRAVAVISVVVFHFFTRGATGGYLGVDMFFVLSGYLITTLLLLEWTNHRTIGLRAFWARRARRLLPALLLVLTVVAIWSAFALDAARRSSVRGQGLSALFYSANWYLIFGGEESIGRAGGLAPLFHTWSLAIEEQFYLVWPVVVVLCLRRWGGALRPLVIVAVTASVVSLVLMPVLFVPGTEARAYLATDTRAHQLLIGALLAMALQTQVWRARSERWAPRLAPFAALAIVAAVLFAPGPETSKFLYYGGSVGFALCVAVVIAAVMAPTSSWLKALLALAPLVWLGRISYGVYLWHVPVRAMVSNAETGLGGPALLIARVVGTVGVAALSYYLIEMPIRRGLVGGRLAHWATPLAVAGVASAIVIATL
jgi:peptidoglycan/LPS O-acetylase OafA/YrhL